MRRNSIVGEIALDAHHGRAAVAAAADQVAKAAQQAGQLPGRGALRLHAAYRVFEAAAELFADVARNPAADCDVGAEYRSPLQGNHAKTVFLIIDEAVGLHARQFPHHRAAVGAQVPGELRFAHRQAENP